MPDNALHEVHLNGKQLVFLFMAATVVAVVIFLCGVMVGRGVDARQAAIASTDSPLAALDTSVLPPTSSVSGGAPVTAGETLTYPGLLDNAEPPEEALVPVDDTTAPAETSSAPQPAAEAAPATDSGPVVEPEPVTEPEAVAAAEAARDADSMPVAPEAEDADPLSAPFAEPPGTGFVVQVAAVDQRAEAEIIARRLRTRGYPTFVTVLGDGRMFRVRVGKYDDRREAEVVAGRLEREEQFQPWITR